MIKVKVVTSNNRGFLTYLFDYLFKDISFSYNKSTIYERKDGKSIKMLIKKLLRYFLSFRICDYLGVFQIIHSRNKVSDVEFSFNRFVKGKKPYVIYLENPGALLNYHWNRSRYKITKLRLRKQFENPNLKAIICMSNSCKDGLYKIYDIPESLRVETIFPLITNREDIDEEVIKNRQSNKYIECLFVAEYFRKKGGKDLLEVFKLIRKNDMPFRLHIITGLNFLDENDKEEIENNELIDIHDFSFSKKEMLEIYKNSDILLNPTRVDSFSLVTLEAIKAGCLVVGTNLYAIKEMVPKELNLYLMDPYYKYWREDNLLNLDIACNQKNTIDGDFIDQSLVHKIFILLKMLNDNREKLTNDCIFTLMASKSGILDEHGIVSAWNNVFQAMLK